MNQWTGVKQKQTNKQQNKFIKVKNEKVWYISMQLSFVCVCVCLCYWTKRTNVVQNEGKCKRKPKGNSINQVDHSCDDHVMCL